MYLYTKVWLIYIHKKKAYVVFWQEFLFNFFLGLS